MRKFFGALALMLLAGMAQAQDTQRVVLATSWDMNGEAADDDQIVVVGNGVLTDSASYTLTAQPDTCRVVNITVVDANSSVTAGLLTITGTDCWDDALTCTYTFAAAGSGVKALTYGTGNGTICAFKTVTTVETGVLTGEGGAGDTMIVGYTANSDYSYPIYGIRKQANGRRWVDPFAKRNGVGTITINGTAVASYATAGGGAFQNLAAGDLIYIVLNGTTYERKLVTVTDDDNAVLDLALPTSIAPATTAEVRFKYQKFFVLVEPRDAWIPVKNRNSFYVINDIDACSATGGCTSNVECSQADNIGYTDQEPTVQVDTDNVADAGTGTNTTSVDFRTAPMSYCRVGMKFGTGDTSGTEDFNLVVTIKRDN